MFSAFEKKRCVWLASAKTDFFESSLALGQRPFFKPNASGGEALVQEAFKDGDQIFCSLSESLLLAMLETSTLSLATESWRSAVF